MDIRADPFFADVFERPVFRVAVDPSDEPRAPLEAHVAGHERAFYFAKVSAGDIALMRELLAAGFYVVDVNVVFDWVVGSELAGPADGVEVRDELPETARDALLDLAASSFLYSRFHLDPLLSRSEADRTKRAWVESYVDGARGDSLLVAFTGDRPVGFLAVLVADVDGQREAVIDLIGVGPKHRRRGIAAALVTSFVERYRDSCHRLRVGTQVANIPSVRLYERLGFSLSHSQYVLHMHVRDGRVAR